MSRFFPRAAYEEDQPLGKTILSTHVLYRGFQSGALVGAGTDAIRATLKARKAAGVRAAFAPTLLRAAGVGAVWGTGLSALALVGRMYGRQDIEWKDRSWRLLANEGQMEVDDWSGVGSVAGAALSTQVRSQPGLSTLYRLSGGAGLGSLVGVAGYMAWRYGMHGGKR